MAFRDTKLGTAVRTTPADAAVQICTALRKADGRRGVAAKALGISLRQLLRYIETLTGAGHAIAPLRAVGERNWATPTRAPKRAQKRRESVAP